MPIELHHLGVNDALTFNGHQRRRKAKRHAHLELGGVATLVAFLFRQYIHAVVVFTTKPELALFGHIDRAGCLNSVATSVFGGDDQLNLTCLAKFGLAQQQPA